MSSEDGEEVCVACGGGVDSAEELEKVLQEKQD
jgi:hypothetical protein